MIGIVAYAQRIEQTRSSSKKCSNEMLCCCLIHQEHLWSLAVESWMEISDSVLIDCQTTQSTEAILCWLLKTEVKILSSNNPL